MGKARHERRKPHYGLRRFVAITGIALALAGAFTYGLVTSAKGDVITADVRVCEWFPEFGSFHVMYAREAANVERWERPAHHADPELRRAALRLAEWMEIHPAATSAHGMQSSVRDMCNPDMAPRV